MRSTMFRALVALVMLLSVTSGVASASTDLDGSDRDGAAPYAPGAQRHEESTRLAPRVSGTPAEYREAAAASEATLGSLSSGAQRIVTTPVEETIVFESVPQPQEDEPIQRAYGGHQGNGCWNLKVTKTTKNGFGWVLTRAETTVMNYCISNDQFTTTPSTFRYTNSHWGWAQCGWVNTYSGWDGPWNLYRGAGIARFALSNIGCVSPQVQLRNEIAARHDGNWWYWT